ncbi:MAG: histidinol-phosphatase HisJ family protein [Oscillospiraceae bacterium]
MFLADYHMHSFPFSPDAQNSMLQMAEASAEHGITHICITNHIENCSQSPKCPLQFPPFHEWEALETAFNTAKSKMDGRIDMRLGIELGSPHYVPEIGRKIYSMEMFDFVIGSIHNLREGEDFCYYTYPPFNEFSPTIEEYLQEYIKLAKFGCCDVLGHIGYMQKYMADQNVYFDMMEFSDLLKELFSAAIQNGIGIEVNTSSLHEKLGEFVPKLEVLKLYRELGGEVITAGSDSHSVKHAGFAIKEAYELLREAGFKYVCIFRRHEPEFIKL